MAEAILNSSYQGRKAANYEGFTQSDGTPDSDNVNIIGSDIKPRYSPYQHYKFESTSLYVYTSRFNSLTVKVWREDISTLRKNVHYSSPQKNRGQKLVFNNCNGSCSPSACSKHTKLIKQLDDTFRDEKIGLF